jgi:hypothetical protein
MVMLSHTEFNFTNTGTQDLFISNAVGSCGCTVPEWPREPIKPGKSGKIKVEFDSQGQTRGTVEDCNCNLQYR